MKRNFLLLAAAASFALTTACNQDKPAAVDAATTPSADTAVVVDNDGADTTVYQDQAYRTADQVAADLGYTSDTMRVRRLRTTYYTRAQRLGDLDEATDTVGRYATVRQINTDTDEEVRTIVNDDAKYRTYETNRSRYYGDGYVTTTTTTTTETASRPRRRGPRIVKYERKGGDVKIVYSNGTTVKIDKDGDRKVEYADGTKVKRDADDGQVKIKD
ncbi:hypothetical protein EJV47_13225 [Hymenobacter gummosus]|uniref:Centromere protein J C-terminal domain-containing protein n=1 Tax=Hymenobacter gummosus TaxID=1776032 RepID=A0A3S0HND8_9BACT|nr:T-complex 10 C-terminal domain-containing protein [Hymenobacter gummosus]RTQ49765.1 hypothetical protein EJV47_13225 [Hymenobacter gummosus]